MNDTPPPVVGNPNAGKVSKMMSLSKQLAKAIENKDRKLRK
jgi:hypothetical protein